MSTATAATKHRGTAASLFMAFSRILAPCCDFRSPHFRLLEGPELGALARSSQLLFIRCPLTGMQPSTPPTSVGPCPNIGTRLIKTAQRAARSIRRMDSISDVQEPKPWDGKDRPRSEERRVGKEGRSRGSP